MHSVVRYGASGERGFGFWREVGADFLESGFASKKNGLLSVCLHVPILCSLLARNSLGSSRA